MFEMKLKFKQFSKNLSSINTKNVLKNPKYFKYILVCNQGWVICICSGG